MSTPQDAPSTALKVTTAALFFPLMLIKMVIQAGVLCKIWIWLIVPHFHVAPISPLAAYGVALFLNYCTEQNPRDNPDSFVKQYWSSLIFSLMSSVLALFGAWLATWVLA